MFTNIPAHIYACTFTEISHTYIHTHMHACLQAGSTYGIFTNHAHSLYHACHIHKIVNQAANPLVIAVSIPLYEFTIYPLFHKYVLPMLKRIGVGMTVALLGILCISIMDIIGQAQNTAGCMFYGRPTEKISLDSRWLVLPVCLEAFGEMLVVIPSKLHGCDELRV